MKFSVLIPAYNASKTIEQTLDSLFSQSYQPFEILVMDDGSTDDTLSTLKTYGPRVTVYHQENKGLAASRNFLCRMAAGEAIAFLDSDDLWHPSYLETQAKVIASNPRAVASFTGHVDLHGLGEFKWDNEPAGPGLASKLIESVDFFTLYNKASGLFLPSSCCVPKKVLEDIGPEPFNPKHRRSEDWYFLSQLTLKGPIVSILNRLMAYRITASSLSQDQLANARYTLAGFESMKEIYTRNASPGLRNAYRAALASKMRFYAKILVGLGESSEARKVLIGSIAACRAPLSVSKSSYLLAAMNFPRIFKKHWTPRYRGINSNQ